MEQTWNKKPFQGNKKTLKPLKLQGFSLVRGTGLEKGTLHIQLQPLLPRRDLRQIRGSFAALTNKSSYKGTALDDYLHIILTDEEDVPEAIGKLRLIYPNIMKLSYDNTRTRTDRVIDAAADVQRKAPLELFEELYEMQNNQPMSEEQRIFAQDLIESIWEERV